MALFGVPISHTSKAEISQDAVHAVQCALAMRRALIQLNQRWQEQQQPTIRMRVGIYTGPLVAGAVGDPPPGDPPLAAEQQASPRILLHHATPHTGAAPRPAYEPTPHPAPAAAPPPPPSRVGEPAAPRGRASYPARPTAGAARAARPPAPPAARGGPAPPPAAGSPRAPAAGARRRAGGDRRATP